MILLVEDNRAVRKMIRLLIEDFGDDVCECEDGSEALAAFEICQPRWVLMDLAMRRMNGIDATRQITAAFPAAKIAIVTSHDDDDGLRRAAAEAGALEYVSKNNLIDLRRVLAH
jgi:CheY-like chemotaxis protein